MGIRVKFTEDPAEALKEAEKFLASDPVRHNLTLTLLNGRVARPEPGRYWVAKNGPEAVGTMFQSPFNYPVLVSPAEYDAVIALADALIEVDRSVPGVGSSAAVAAQFAGRWTELTGQGARPTRGMRLYEAVGKNEVPASRGKIREAGENDRELVVRWMGSFLEDVNEPARDVEQVVGSGVEERRFWLWEDGSTPVSMAARSIAVEGVVRIQAVYTPPEQRNRGYAGACVGALTAQLLASGLRCILYTDLANPTSNSVYRRIGYRAVDEGLRYEFETGEG